MEEREAQYEHTPSIDTEPNNVVFTLSPVKEIPKKKPRKKTSKHDRILNAFLEGEDKLTEIKREGRNISYLLYGFRYELNERINARVTINIFISLCMQSPLSAKMPKRTTHLSY